MCKLKRGAEGGSIGYKITAQMCTDYSPDYNPDEILRRTEKSIRLVMDH